MSFKHFVFVLLCCCFTTNASYAQKRKIQHNPGYDKRPFHLGFTLGFNRLDYRIFPSKYMLFAHSTDSVYRVDPARTIGINLGIVSDLRMGEHFNLRFLPGMIFGQRNLVYKMRDLSKIDEMVFYQYNMKLSSIHLDAPLSVKFRANRINNYRMYLIAGMALKYDLETKRVLKENTDYSIKQRPLDYYYEFGFGIDWYLVYFKFSTEVKLSFGLRNLLIYDPIEYVRVIDELKSKMLIFSFHFE
ncbi:MAG: PorT family protein [Bacteroidales bacterium]|nr:PorT family protein [Bacteroidales bacterium]NLK81514.1 PorT family protein [Bacteroidales bacterium]HPY82432.1 porin family protein [Bacteroidales bacterium]